MALVMAPPMVPPPQHQPAPAAAFKFAVPHCPRGTMLRLQTPDGFVLDVPVPDQADIGDEVHMARMPNGQWGMRHIVKMGMPGGMPQAQMPAQMPAPAPSQVRAPAPAPAPAPSTAERRSIFSEAVTPATTAKTDGSFKSTAEIEADLKGPDVIKVLFDTSKGPVLMKIVPSWSPRGAQRFLQMVADGYFRDIAIYRGVPNFLLQFGITNDPSRNARYAKIEDDSLVGVPYLDGMIGFAAAGPNTRTTTLCWFLADIAYLGKSSVETPIGMICPGESMHTLHSLACPGDIPQCGGQGPDPDQLGSIGNDYIIQNFPECDFIMGASRCP